MTSLITAALAHLDHDAALVAELHENPGAPRTNLPLHIVFSLDALTPRTGETHAEHLERIRADRVALLVAVAANTVQFVRCWDDVDADLVVCPERHRLLDGCCLSAAEVDTLLRAVLDADRKQTGAPA